MPERRYGACEPATFVAMLILTWPFVPFDAVMLSNIFQAPPSPFLDSMYEIARPASLEQFTIECNHTI